MSNFTRKILLRTVVAFQFVIVVFIQTEFCYGSSQKINVSQALENAKNIINLDEKLSILLEIIKIEPDNLEANRELGVVYFLKNDIETSDYYLTRAVLISSNETQPVKEQQGYNSEINEKINATNKKRDAGGITGDDAGVITGGVDTEIKSETYYKPPEQYKDNSVDNGNSNRSKKAYSNQNYEFTGTSELNAIRRQVESKNLKALPEWLKPAGSFIENENAGKIEEDNKTGHNINAKDIDLFIKDNNSNRIIPLPPLPESTASSTEPNSSYRDSFKSNVLAQNIEIKNKFNLNSVTEEELAAVPNLTDMDRTVIIKYREDYGYFSRLDDLKKAPGLSSKYESVKDYFYIGAPKYENNYETESDLKITEKNKPQNTIEMKIPIDINNADSLELQSALGISELEATMILKYIDRYGVFKNKEEFRNIPIIGKKYDLLKDNFEIK